MKKSNILIATICSLSFLGIATSTGLATDVTSKADVEFTPNGGIIDPVDPEEGGVIEPNKPPTSGPLSINYASDIVFGAHKKTRDKQVFYALDDTITVIETGEKKQTPNFVQVTDLRGTATGWTLSVRQNGPLKKNNGVSIVGGKLTLSARSIESMYGFTGIPSSLATDVELSEEGQSHEIVKAEAGAGVSTWSTFLGNAGDQKSGINLSLPKDSVKETGVYSTSLTWFLQDVL